MTAAFQRSLLACAHQLASDPLAAQTVQHPKIFYEEPAAVGFTREAGDDPLPIPHEDAQGFPRLMPRPAAFVEGFQPLREDFNVRFFGLVFNVEAKA